MYSQNILCVYIPGMYYVFVCEREKVKSYSQLSNNKKAQKNVKKKKLLILFFFFKWKKKKPEALDSELLSIASGKALQESMLKYLQCLETQMTANQVRH